MAVITDGTAIRGLRNLGSLAAKPVMEGKGVLFKRFAGIDASILKSARPSGQRFYTL